MYDGVDMEGEPTNREILEAINVFSENVDQRFSNLETDVKILKTDVACLKTDVACLKTDVACLKTDVGALKTDVGYLKTAMVTKDYLDDKLAQFKIGLKDSAARFGRQVNRLIVELHKGGVLSAEQVVQIRAD